MERDAKLAAGLRASVQRLKATTMKVHAADALAWMRAAPRGGFDLVLLDPPFAADLFDAALTAALPLLTEGGLIYVEAPHEITPPAGFTVWRQGRAGAVHYHLLRREDNPTP